MLFRTKYVSGVYHTLGINIIISERLKFFNEEVRLHFMCFQPEKHLSNGGGRKAPNPTETIIFMKEILSPFLNNSEAKCKSQYKEEKQHQIIEELGWLHEALMASRCYVCIMSSGLCIKNPHFALGTIFEIPSEKNVCRPEHLGGV